MFIFNLILLLWCFCLSFKMLSCIYPPIIVSSLSLFHSLFVFFNYFLFPYLLVLFFTLITLSSSLFYISICCSLFSFYHFLVSSFVSILLSASLSSPFIRLSYSLSRFTYGINCVFLSSSSFLYFQMISFDVMLSFSVSIFPSSLPTVPMSKVQYFLLILNTDITWVNSLQKVLHYN